MKKIRIFTDLVFILAAAASAFYKVRIRLDSDTTGPVITMDSPTVTVSTGAGEEELLAGVQAEDSRDGDVTDSLLVEKLSNFVEKGRRNITIAAFDSDNNVTKTTREVVYSDYHSPRYLLDGPLKFPMDSEDIFTVVHAEDMLDGDLTEKVKVSGDNYVDVYTEGEYPILFTVSNSAGDVSELEVLVEIYDRTKEADKPQIGLSQYIVYTTVGTPVNPWDYVQQISYRGTDYIREADGVLRDPYAEEGQNITYIGENEVSISSEADYNTPGTYEITYRISLEGSGTGSVRLIAVVE